VIPFRVDFRPGASLYEQVVYAAKKAMISGQIRPGDPFPSVRVLSNTAHKVVMHLAAGGLLEARPGIGTVVAELPEARKIERTQLLGREIEQLVVEAKKLSIPLEEVVASISEHWRKLGGRQHGDPEAERGGRGK